MVSLAAMRDERKEAEKSPALVTHFRRYWLNQWQTGGHAETWLESSDYDRSAEPQRSLAELEGEPCWIGIDLGHTQDLTAVVLAFRQPVPAGDGYVVDIHARHFVPGRWLEKRGDKDRVDYLAAEKRGELTRDGEVSMSYEVVTDWIGDLVETYDVRRIGVDPYRSEVIEPALRDLRVELVAHGQGMAAMARPTMVTRNLIAAGRFRHGGLRLLRSNFLNAVAQTDHAGNQRLSKALSRPRGRIDGAVAAVMAAGMATEDMVQQTPAEIMRAMRERIEARRTLAGATEGDPPATASQGID